MASAGTSLAASIKQTTEKFPLINGLIAFIDCHLAPSEEDSLVSKLEPVVKGTKIAASFIENISTEAEKSETSEIHKYIADDIISTAKGLGETHWLVQGLAVAAYTNVRSQISQAIKELGESESDWLFLGLAVAAYTIERCVKEESVEPNCWELMSTVLELAKDLKFFRKEMPHEKKILELAKNLEFSEEMPNERAKSLKFSEEKKQKMKILKDSVTTIVESKEVQFLV